MIVVLYGSTSHRLQLAPHLIGLIAIAAYSYMALIPVYQLLIMADD